MRIIFIRHTQTEANQKKIYGGQVDYKLTTKGADDVIYTCEKLLSYYSDINKFEKIYTSPLSRCKILAYEINNNLNTTITNEESLLEYNFGIFEGKSFSDLESVIEYKDWCADYVAYKIPNGESLIECRDRVKSFIDTLLYENKDVIVVAHEGIIKLAILILLNLENNMFWNFKISNGGICEVEIKHGIAFIKNLINQ